MNRVHAYLFFFFFLNIYRYQVKEFGYFLLTYKINEKSKHFSGNFWMEWEEYAGYLEGDKVDFAFLSDDIAFKFPGLEIYSFVNPTKYFNIGKIIKFMEEKLDYNDLSFEFNGREEKIIKCKLGYKGPKKFYLSIPYPFSETAEYQKPSNGDSVLGDFFIKKAHEYENNYK
jgi:hypothetical protein